LTGALPEKVYKKKRKRANKKDVPETKVTPETTTQPESTK
jgi:hypothetical protein